MVGRWLGGEFGLTRVLSRPAAALAPERGRAVLLARPAPPVRAAARVATTTRRRGKGLCPKVSATPPVGPDAHPYPHHIFVVVLGQAHEIGEDREGDE
eukprot:CAMPEP_0185199398 /NCGR_PEP_ID=MMETSP1140-20130426/45021_1 /TAXON_ID=298111 /ORGANISM="Pavlova sp., Strain CCMP459" /LENGTH=97 /DNA_ID=CAMNT_0027766669 /DNA_START=672 /DNA_END=965 /DNA_ORIENTATION=-